MTADIPEPPADFLRGRTAIQIRDTDQVATATADIEPGETVYITGVRNGAQVLARQRIPAGHKIALVGIHAHTEIRKYGEVIGLATSDIGEGEHVHVHNCRGLKARRFTTDHQDGTDHGDAL